MSAESLPRSHSVLRGLVVAAVAAFAGCDTGPMVVLNDGGLPPSADAAPGADAAARLPWLELPREEPLIGAPLPIVPSAGWSSPPECATSHEDAHCGQCWSWTDSGPSSLDRNEAGDAFGYAIAVDDFNGDGYPDLAATAPLESDGSTYDGSIYVYLGTSRGFQPWRAIRLHDFGLSSYDAVMGGALAAGDFDNDGVADLAVAFWSTLLGQPGLIGITYGGPGGFQGGHTFDLPTMDPDGSTALIMVGESLTAGDFDGDGDDDLAVGTPEYPTDNYTNAGAVFVLEGSPSGLAPAARLDLWNAGIAPLAEDRFGGSVTVFRNSWSADQLVVGMPGYGWILAFDGGSSIGGPYVYSEVPNLGTRVVAGDLDNDGLMDILASGSSGSTVFTMNTGTGVGGKVDSFHSEGSYSLHPLAIVDLDGDGSADIVAYSEGQSGGHAILLYQGNGGFDPPPLAELTNADRESTDLLGWSASVADVDGDGLTDIVAGAPALAGGFGRVHVFAVDDPGDWALPPAALQMIDQELSLDICDICFVQEWSDGTVCDSVGDEICVIGACVARGCGDGYREPGTTAWPREGCDDGNTADGDACSSMCQPERLVVSSEPFEEASPGRPALAEDDRGELLFVYTADAGEGRELRARRYSSAGVARDAEPIIVASGFTAGWDLEPSVAGLLTDDSSGGWIVAWTDPEVDGEGAGIAAVEVGPTGLLGRVEAANTQTAGSQRSPRAFAFPGGHGVVWVDEGGIDGPVGRSIIKVRAVGNDGAVVIAEHAVSAPDAVASEPALAIADGAVVVWTQASAEDPDELSYVMGCLIGESLGEPFVIAGPGASQPAVISRDDGPIVVTWVRRDPTYDYLGDILAGTINTLSVPPALGSTWTIVERQSSEPPRAQLAPSIAYLGDSAVVAYEDGGRRRGVGLGYIGSAMAPEAADIADYLVDGLQGDVTVLHTSRGVWFTWSDASGYGDPDAYRSVLAYLLPYD